MIANYHADGILSRLHDTMKLTNEDLSTKFNIQNIDFEDLIIFIMDQAGARLKSSKNILKFSLCTKSCDSITSA